MGWLPSAPQLSKNPLALAAAAAKEGVDVQKYVTDKLKSGEITHRL